jgi:hypothetical protein
MNMIQWSSLIKWVSIYEQKESFLDQCCLISKFENEIKYF